MRRFEPIVRKLACGVAWLVVGFLVVAFVSHAAVTLVTNRVRARADAVTLDCHRLVGTVEARARELATGRTAAATAEDLIREFAAQRNPVDPSAPAVVSLDADRDAPPCQIALAVVAGAEGPASLVGLQVRNDVRPRSDVSTFRSFRIEW